MIIWNQVTCQFNKYIQLSVQYGIQAAQATILESFGAISHKFQKVYNFQFSNIMIC